MPHPKSYRSFADFEREMIRPCFKVGMSVEDLVEDTSFDDWPLEEDLFDRPDDE